MNYIYPTNWILLVLVLIIGNVICWFGCYIIYLIVKFLFHLLTLGYSICYTLNKAFQDQTIRSIIITVAHEKPAA